MTLTDALVLAALVLIAVALTCYSHWRKKKRAQQDCTSQHSCAVCPFHSSCGCTAADACANCIHNPNKQKDG